jgi:hypothetical protein
MMDLRQAFDDNVGIVMRVRGLPRPEAEQAAFENTLVDHHNATLPDTPSDRRAHCGRRSETLLPIGIGERHTWLRAACWKQWRADRRAKAIAGLTEAGIQVRTLPEIAEERVNG